MNKVKKSFFIIVLSGICLANNIVSEFWERPQPESYQATILTAISGSMLKNTQHNESTIYVSGDLLRIDTLTPTRTITLKKDKQTWVIGPDGNVSELDQEQTSLAQKKPEDILKEFEFTETQTQNKKTICTGVPRSNNPENHFSSKHFSKIIVVFDNTKNTIEDIQIYNKKGLLAAQFSFTYQALGQYWMNEMVKINIHIGNQKLSITQTYQNLQIIKLPPNLFELNSIQQNRGK